MYHTVNIIAHVATLWYITNVSAKHEATFPMLRRMGCTSCRLVTGDLVFLAWSKPSPWRSPPELSGFHAIAASY